jgi:hypothetical protein
MPPDKPKSDAGIKVPKAIILLRDSNTRDIVETIRGRLSITETDGKGIDIIIEETENSSQNGPAKVNSGAFRNGWDGIWGRKNDLPN